MAYKSKKRFGYRPYLSKKSEIIRIPFGKYQGRTFDQIPKYYLEWLLEQDICKPNHKSEIIRVLNNWKKQKEFYKPKKTRYNNE